MSHKRKKKILVQQHEYLHDDRVIVIGLRNPWTHLFNGPSTACAILALPIDSGTPYTVYCVSIAFVAQLSLATLSQRSRLCHLFEDNEWIQQRVRFLAQLKTNWSIGELALCELIIMPISSYATWPVGEMSIMGVVMYMYAKCTLGEVSLGELTRTA